MFQKCTVSIENGTSKKILLDVTVSSLRDHWEQTSFKLESRQCNPLCVAEEAQSLHERDGPSYELTFDVNITATGHSMSMPAPRLAVIREEGTNGDRELAAAFFTAGFEVHDVTMTDLIGGNVSLDKFQGLAFAGGFAHADVLGSAKGKTYTSSFQTRVHMDETFYVDLFS